MKKFFLIFLLLICTIRLYAQVRVRGYYRSNGTYVQPNYRSNPDGNPYNNWSYPGNVNPYTGKVANGDPDTYLRNYYNKNSGSVGNTSRNYRSYSSPSLPSHSGSDNYNSNSIPSATVNTDFDELLKEYATELERNRIRNQRESNATNYSASTDYSSQSYTERIATQNSISFHERYNHQEKMTLEEALNDLGYDIGLADGIFDESTIKGIKEFQKRYRLKVDGRLGSTSVNRLGFRLK